MTRVYIANCSFFQNEHVIARVLPQVDAHRKAKIHTLQTLEKKAQSIVAGLLLTSVFGKDATYRYTDKGKPYLADNSAFFSLSHCDKWVALAVSDTEIGFDLQSISPIRPAVLRRCFTQEEQAWIGDDAERFIQLWTRKEAYAKYTSCGLTAPFSECTPDLSVPFTEGIWTQMRYALYGDNTIDIQVLNTEKDLL